MHFACLLMTHLDPALTRDTLESIQSYMTRDNLILVDGKFWPAFAKLDFGCPMMKGQEHGHSCSPYRNQLIGFQRLRILYPNADWYAYVENDVLFANSNFKQDIQALPSTFWSAGFDVREAPDPWPVLSKHFGIRVIHHRIMIGCCQFYHRDMFVALEKLDFFSRFLQLSSNYGPRFPDYNHVAVEEGLLPSLCHYYHKFTFQLGNWEAGLHQHSYAVRFRPLWQMHEMTRNFSIIHPIKEVEDIRKRYKKIREFISGNSSR